MAQTMTPAERRAFLAESTRTAHVATTREDGRAHVAPVWFTLDGEDIVFTTHNASVKGTNLLRTGQAAISVDDPIPPFSFVALAGDVTAIEDPEQVLHWAIVIAERYMGEDRAEEFGKRNGIPGELVCRLHPVSITGVRDLVR